MFIGLAGLLWSADLDTKKGLCHLFITLAYSKSSFLQDCTKEKAWQVVVVVCYFLYEYFNFIKIDT